MILYIQTVSKKTEIYILNQQTDILRDITWKQEKNQSEKLLRSIHELLAGEIPEKILVMNGMGSYTGTRIGISIANTLAFAWKIPIGAVTTSSYVGDQEDFHSQEYIQSFFNNPEWRDTVMPVYNREPKIG